MMSNHEFLLNLPENVPDSHSDMSTSRSRSSSLSGISGASDESAHKFVQQVDHNLPVISKSYEEEFLRSPVGKERCCSSGESCEGKFVSHSPGFILREFLFPDEQERFKLFGELHLPSRTRMCVLCMRKDVQRNLNGLKKISSGMNAEEFSIQPYVNFKSYLVGINFFN